MDFEDLDKPVTTGRAGRVILGVVFLAFAAIVAFLTMTVVREGDFTHPGFLVFLASLAIVVGYVGYRLVKMAGDEQLLGRRASIVAAVIMIVGGVAIGVFLVRATPSDKSVDALLMAVGSIVGGWWLLRSKVRHKDGP
jgi:membrane associated rhomboid family serine protease